MADSMFQKAKKKIQGAFDRPTPYDAGDNPQRAPTIRQVNPNYRSQWMHEVEAGSTSLSYGEWLSHREHGIRNPSGDE